MSIRRATGLNLTQQYVEKSLHDNTFSAGTPSQPTLTIDSTTGNLSWTAATGSAGTTLGYGISSFPSGPTWAISGTSAVLSNLEPGTTYTFSVWGVNIAGAGIPSTPKKLTVAFNSATGGTETTVTNYNGTSETWKLHTFTANGTFTPSSSQLPYNVLLVANGASGGGPQGWTLSGQGGGAGGRVLNETNTRLTTGALSVVIGGNTTLGSKSSANGNPSAGQATPGPTSTITGSSTYYGGGGGAGGGPGWGIGHHNGPPGQAGGQGGGGPGAAGGTEGQAANGWGGGSGSPGTAGLGGGGGGVGGRINYGTGNDKSGGSGGSGRAVIAYRIA